MEAEIQNKHSEKRKLRKETRKIRTTLKRGLNLIILNTVFYQLNVALKSKFKVVTSRHEKKLSNFLKHQKLKLLNQNPTMLKILYRTFLHINYQQMNKLHYRTELIPIFLLHLITIEYIPSSHSFTKAF